MNRVINVHQYDPVIYPVKLWVVFTKDTEGLNEIFCTYPAKQDVASLSEFDALANVNLVREKKEGGCIGVLAMFCNKREATPKLIAHEATHVSQYIWERVNERHIGDEADAYLMGWIVECIFDAKKK